MKGYSVISEELGKGFRRFTYKRGRREIVLDDPGASFIFDTFEDAGKICTEVNRLIPGCHFRVYRLWGERR